MVNLVIGISSIIALMIQFGIINRLPLLTGTADILILLIAAWSLQDQIKHFWVHTIIIGVFVSLISSMPFFAPLISYLLTFFIGFLIKHRLWQVPVLSIFLLVFISTLLQHLIYISVLQINGVIFNWYTAFLNITLPSLLINILLVIPVYAVVQELAVLFTPKGQEA